MSAADFAAWERELRPAWSPLDSPSDEARMGPGYTPGERPRWAPSPYPWAREP